MEINKYEDITGVQTNEDIVEGRMVLLTTNANATWDFGSGGDVPGVKQPETSTEAAKARYILTWAVDNRETPIFDSMPQTTFGLRGGFGAAANSPFTSKVRMVHPSNTNGETIPSGTLSLAFGPGVYTVYSGQFVYNANMLVPGCYLAVADTASDSVADKGKLKYSASASFAQVERFNTENYSLTFRINY